MSESQFRHARSVDRSFWLMVVGCLTGRTHITAAIRIADLVCLDVCQVPGLIGRLAGEPAVRDVVLGSGLSSASIAENLKIIDAAVQQREGIPF